MSSSPSFFDELINKLLNVLPKNTSEMRNELSKNFRQILQSTFDKMNLVTREEFEAQVKVLHRTNAKIAELEQKLAELQAKNLPSDQ